MQPYPRAPDLVWPGHLHGAGCLSARAVGTGFPTVGLRWWLGPGCGWSWVLSSPARRGWGLGWLCLGSVCGVVPLLPAVCGVRGWALVSARFRDVCGFLRVFLAPRRFRFRCAVWACVLGPGLGCAPPFLAGLSGCVFCAFFFSGCWVSPSRALWSLPPSPFFSAGLLAFLFFVGVCLFRCPFSRWAAVPGLVLPVFAGWSPCACLGVLSSVPSGWGVWPPSVFLAGGLVAVGFFARPPFLRPPPPFFFLFWGGGAAWLFLPLPSLGWRLLCGWCVVWLVPRHSWRRCLCATPRHSWLGFAAGGCGRSPPLLAGVRWRWWCVVCGVLVGLWLVCGVVGPSPLLAEVPVCYSPPLLAGFRCRWWWAVPATPGWGPLAALLCGVWCVAVVCWWGCGSCVVWLVPRHSWRWFLCATPRHSWLGFAAGGGGRSPHLLAGARLRRWCVVCGVWCVVVVCWWGCGWCVVWLVPRHSWRWFLCASPRYSWLGFAAAGGGRSPPLLAGVHWRRWCVVCGVWCVAVVCCWGCGWCVACGGGVLLGLWLVCGVVGPSPLLAVVPVCYSPPLLAGFRCRWWWAVPATPGWGPLAAVVCGVRCVVCWWGPSPLLAEVAVCYSPPLLAGFRWRRWCVVCGVWCVAVVCCWGGGWCVVWLVPRHSWRRSLCATPRHSWLGFAAGGGGRSPPLLAGVRWRRWCVVCGVWCVAVVCCWGCGWCVVWLVPRHSWRRSLCATPRHSWLGFAAGGRSPPLLAGVRWRRWCVVCGVLVGSLATPGGGSCVLLPATPGLVSLPLVVGGPRHSWLGSAGGGGVWCVFVCVLCLAGSGGPASRARSGAPHLFLWPLCLPALPGPLRAGVAPLSFAAVAVPRWLFFSASCCLALRALAPRLCLRLGRWLLFGGCSPAPLPFCVSRFSSLLLGALVFFFFFLLLLFPLCAPVVFRPRVPWASALALFALFAFRFWALRALVALSCLPPGCWLLPRGCCPPPFVFRGFRSCRWVLCAVLCCASLGAVLRRAAARCVARCSAVVCCVALVWCRCLLRRALWRCPPPWALCSAALCFAVFPRAVCSVLCVFCRGAVVRAVVRRSALCCVCLGVLCCAFPVLSVLCGAVLRCAGALVLCCSCGACCCWRLVLWCAAVCCAVSCGVPWCGAGSGGPWLSAGGVFRCRCSCLAAWSASLWLVWFAVVPCFPVSCSVVLCCHVVLCCCALLSCCGAVGACFALLWAVVLCCVVLLVGCAVFGPVVVSACCGALFLVLCVPCLLRSVRCGALLCWLWCPASLRRVLWRCAAVWCCAVVLCCRFAVLFVLALPSCGLSCGASVVCAVVGPSCCGVSLCVVVSSWAFCGVVVLLWCVVVSCCAVRCPVVSCALCRVLRCRAALRCCAVCFSFCPVFLC